MRWLRRSAFFKRVLAMLPAGIGGDSAAAATKPPTYREALEASCGSQAGPQLQGVPTYRLPQHPQYLSAFSNPVYKPLWHRACGSGSYTRLVGVAQLAACGGGVGWRRSLQYSLLVALCRL